MNININAPYNFLSYGICSTNICAELAKRGNILSIFPIGQVDAEPKHHQWLKQAIDNQAFFDNNAPSVRIYHQFALAETIGNGLKIGFPIFELDRFNDREKHHLRSCDHLFVCSRWAEDVIFNEHVQYLSGGATCCVVPLGYDPEIFYPEEQKSTAGPLRLLNIGKFEIRKSHPELIEAFVKAFEPDDDIELWMLPNNVFLSPQETKEWAGLLKNHKLGDKVKILGPVRSHNEVANIIRQADVGVFPSKAEGWNLPLLEAMSCNKPCIVTNYSAHTEFCNYDNSYLIDIDKTEPAHDGRWFFGQGEWAYFGSSQMEQLVEHLRFVYNNRGNLKQPAASVSQFTWSNSAKIFEEHLNDFQN